VVRQRTSRGGGRPMRPRLRRTSRSRSGAHGSGRAIERPAVGRRYRELRSRMWAERRIARQLCARRSTPPSVAHGRGSTSALLRRHSRWRGDPQAPRGRRTKRGPAAGGRRTLAGGEADARRAGPWRLPGGQGGSGRRVVRAGGEKRDLRWEGRATVADDEGGRPRRRAAIRESSRQGYCAALGGRATGRAPRLYLRSTS